MAIELDRLLVCKLFEGLDIGESRVQKLKSIEYIICIDWGGGNSSAALVDLTNGSGQVHTCSVRDNTNAQLYTQISGMPYEIQSDSAYTAVMFEDKTQGEGIFKKLAEDAEPIAIGLQAFTGAGHVYQNFKKEPTDGNLAASTTEGIGENQLPCSRKKRMEGFIGLLFNQILKNHGLENVDKNHILLVVGHPTGEAWSVNNKATVNSDRNVLDNYAELIRRATGVDNVMPVSEATAAIRYISKTLKKDLDIKNGIIIVDVGAFTTDIAYIHPAHVDIFRSSQLSMDIGGHLVEERGALLIKKEWIEVLKNQEKSWTEEEATETVEALDEAELIRDLRIAKENYYNGIPEQNIQRRVKRAEKGNVTLSYPINSDLFTRLLNQESYEIAGKVATWKDHFGILLDEVVKTLSDFSVSDVILTGGASLMTDVEMLTGERCRVLAKKSGHDINLISYRKRYTYKTDETVEVEEKVADFKREYNNTVSHGGAYMAMDVLETMERLKQYPELIRSSVKGQLQGDFCRRVAKQLAPYYYSEVTLPAARSWAEGGSEKTDKDLEKEVKMVLKDYKVKSFLAKENHKVARFNDAEIKEITDKVNEWCEETIGSRGDVEAVSLKIKGVGISPEQILGSISKIITSANLFMAFRKGMYEFWIGEYSYSLDKRKKMLESVTKKKSKIIEKIEKELEMTVRSRINSSSDQNINRAIDETVRDLIEKTADQIEGAVYVYGMR